jgi:HTH-type transcriptional regulator, sugar sensing transcriptional regulator
MDEIQRLLGLYGLNDKEIKVYVACLQLGQDTAYNIAEKSGVKRATTYLVLRSLAKKTLVTTHITSKSLLYAASSPQNLVSQLEHRKKELEQSLPSLMAIYNSQPEKPTIEIFEGLEGVKQIYEEIIGLSQKGEDIIFYGDLTHLEKHPSLIKSWLQATKATPGSIRELLNGDEMHAKYKNDVNQNQNSRHEVKLLPEGTRFFLNDNAVFADKLAIFSTQKHFFVTVIKSKEIAASYRTMFNLAWRNV